MRSAFDPLSIGAGAIACNRLMLAPMTNCQSHSDGSISEDEANWLLMRARGGFGSVMTCAAYVHASGQAFAGQLGISSDAHIAGLQSLALALRKAGSVSFVQLHHGGERASAALTGQAVVCPWEQANAHRLSTHEVERVVQDFVAAASRAERAGFDGVEFHAAHGYLLGQFLSAERNLRHDAYGGSFANRRRVLDLILAETRRLSSRQFQIGVRLSPERYGLDTLEMLELAESLMRTSAVDYVDMSLWNCFAPAQDARLSGRTLIECFAALTRGSAKLGVAGNIRSTRDVQQCLDVGVDFALIGRAAILHHDFPEHVRRNPDFIARSLPIPRADLALQGAGEKFIDYLAGWDNFVSA